MAAVSLELKRLLLEELPSPAVMAQGRLLCIQNHLAMVCDSLWAINSMIVIPEMRMLYNKYSKMVDQIFDLESDVPVGFADWKTDVVAAIIDVGELLSRIMDCNTQQVLHFRHVILVELKEMLCHLNSLVLRGSALGLRMDPMASMNPLREDYSIVLKNEVVGREEDLEQLIAIFQQQQQLVPSDDDDDDNNPFVIVIVGKLGVGKTTLAHMIYHHTWVRQQFHHRIWVDLPLELPLQAMWEYINGQLDGSRYLLVLHIQDLARLMQQEWNELKNILLRVGGPGSAVLVISKLVFMLEKDVLRIF